MSVNPPGVEESAEVIDSAVRVLARDVGVTVGRGQESKQIVREVDLDLKSGEFLAILGPSGCGKSTLLKTLAGIQPASEGNIGLAGHSLSSLRHHYPLAIGYLPQFATCHAELTVEEILNHAASLRLPSSCRAEMKQQWLEHLITEAGLQSVRHQRYRTLSGGQRRRIALAEELVGDPPFLFLDELTSGLDPSADREMMAWLQSLAHESGKTIALVTHSVAHLTYCDRILLLHQGEVVFHGTYNELQEILAGQPLDAIYENLPALRQLREESRELIAAAEFDRQPLQTSRPPSGWRQLWPLLMRQFRLLIRDRGQLWLHVLLIISFPMLVAVFATGGLPQVRNLSLDLGSNVVQSMQEHIFYLTESFHAASLVSGLVMFQVILLALMGANNGAREIVKERLILAKEIRLGLSPVAYFFSKLTLVALLSLLQSAAMAWFVKVVCGFPGSLEMQFAILFGVSLSVSVTCLAISAATKTAERASLLAVYLVGLQLPLSGAVLALPDLLSWISRPFIAAYWGWSGYLKTLADDRHYDVIRQVVSTSITDYGLSLTVLLTHLAVMGVLCCFFLRSASEE